MDLHEQTIPIWIKVIKQFNYAYDEQVAEDKIFRKLQKLGVLYELDWSKNSDDTYCTSIIIADGHFKFKSSDCLNIKQSNLDAMKKAIQFLCQLQSFILKFQKLYELTGGDSVQVVESLQLCYPHILVANEDERSFTLAEIVFESEGIDDDETALNQVSERICQFLSKITNEEYNLLSNDDEKQNVSMVSLTSEVNGLSIQTDGKKTTNFNGFRSRTNSRNEMKEQVQQVANRNKNSSMVNLSNRKNEENCKPTPPQQKSMLNIAGVGTIPVQSKEGCLFKDSIRNGLQNSNGDFEVNNNSALKWAKLINDYQIARKCPSIWETLTSLQRQGSQIFVKNIFKNSKSNDDKFYASIIFENIVEFGGEGDTTAKAKVNAVDKFFQHIRNLFHFRHKFRNVINVKKSSLDIVNSLASSKDSLLKIEQDKRENLTTILVSDCVVFTETSEIDLSTSKRIASEKIVKYLKQMFECDNLNSKPKNNNVLLKENLNSLNANSTQVKVQANTNRLGQLIQSFNSVNSVHCKKIKVFDDLRARGHQIKIISMQFENAYYREGPPFRISTLVSFSDIIQFETTPNEYKTTRMDSLQKAYFFLKDLSNLVEDFKKNFQFKPCSKELIDYLLEKNSNILKISFIEEEDIFKTIIKILDIVSYDSKDTDKLTSQHSACSSMVDYLKNLSFLGNEVPKSNSCKCMETAFKVIDCPSTSSPTTKTTNGDHQVNGDSYTNDKNRKPTIDQLVQLIEQFSIFNKTDSPQEIVKKFNNNGSFKIMFDSNNHNGDYETIVKIENHFFISYKDKKYEISKNKALEMGIRYLKNLYHLPQNCKTEFNCVENKNLSPMEIINKIIRSNGEMIFFKSRTIHNNKELEHKQSISHQATITIGQFEEFSAISSTLEDAKNNVSRVALWYLDELVEKFYHSKSTKSNKIICETVPKGGQMQKSFRIIKPKSFGNSSALEFSSEKVEELRKLKFDLAEINLDNMKEPKSDLEIMEIFENRGHKIEIIFGQNDSASKFATKVKFGSLKPFHAQSGNVSTSNGNNMSHDAISEVIRFLRKFHHMTNLFFRLCNQCETKADIFKRLFQSNKGFLFIKNKKISDHQYCAEIELFHIEKMSEMGQNELEALEKVSEKLYSFMIQLN
ncbi:hypothetical protein BLOT_011434 [Blomia tropicalis]|nr:hypothetical protein BLOT_011434 [Blomia tropicalis]